MSSRDLIAPAFARTRLGSGPGLLLAHGAGSSLAGTYGPVLEALAARHTVVGVDYPGSGDTPRSTTPLSVDDLADQLIAAADGGPRPLRRVRLLPRRPGRHPSRRPPP